MRKQNKCKYGSCKKTKRLTKTGALKDSYCVFHANKASTARFLCKTYNSMQRRTQGKSTRTPKLYLGKVVVSKEVFYIWARNHPVFLSLYKQWVSSGFDTKLAPSVNRMDSSKGYTLDNMEWVTFSQNCTLARTVSMMKQKKAIFKLIGVNVNV